MRRVACLVCGMVIISVWAMTPGLADVGPGGGMFVDVPRGHPAFSAVQDLIQRGVIIIGAGGEFVGDAPLLRYDAAQWLSRAIRNVEGARAGADLTPQVTTLTTRVTSLETTMNREVQTLRTQIAQATQGAGAEAAQRAQTAFILGVTGIMLALAAVTLALWF